MPDLLASLQDVLGDRYRLDGELGHGGMATVYRAFDHKLSRPVAIKVLPPDLALILGSDRFKREIAIAAALQHTNIVPLFDSGGRDDLLYYVMPLIGGETLRDRLERETQLPLDDSLRIAREVADALSYAHAQGIVHRDIKPENILLASGRAMVADFGIARAIAEIGGVRLTERLTEKNQVIGTPEYMSPEQASGAEHLDGRSDQYSLACVLFEMLGGDPPFKGRTYQAILAKHMQERPPSLQVVRPTVKPGFQLAMEKALAKVPADRYATPTEFVAALDQELIHPSQIVSRSPKREGKRAIILGTGALLVLATSWVAITGSSAPLDTRKIIVFPLTEATGVAPGAGEQMALLIGSALEQTAPLRWIDGWSWMDAETRADPSSLGQHAARRIARARSARWYLDGALVQSGESTTVILRLNDVAGDSLIDQASASGANEAVAQLGLRAIVRLLPRLTGESKHIDLRDLADRPPGAITAWLQGEQEYRRAKYREANVHYRRALGIDSTLSVAALKAAQVETWIGTPAAADTMVQLALRHDAGLPFRNRAFARGLAAFLAGWADSAVGHFRQSLGADSLWPEAWAALGDTYYHLIPSGTSLDSVAERAFGRAVQLDPAFGPALFHLAEFALRRDEYRAGARLLEAFRAVSPDSGWTDQLELQLDCLRRGRAGVTWATYAVRSPARVVEAMRQLGAGARHPQCANDAARALLAAPRDSVPLSVRWAALKWLHHLSIARGDFANALMLLDSGAIAVHPAAQGLFVLDAAMGAGPQFDERAARVLAALDVGLDHMSSQRLWFFGLWAAHRHDAARLDSISDRLAILARGGSPGDRLLSNAIAARARLLRADTAGAIQLLRKTRAAPGDLAWGIWEAACAERMLLAQLLSATGRASEAAGIAREMDGSQSILNLLYLRPSLELRKNASSDGGQADARRRLRELGSTDLQQQ